MYKNLREFIEHLEREGELLRIKCRVDSEYEICEITDRISKTEGGGKALLFEKTGSDFPIITNMMGSERRISMALGINNTEELTKRIDNLLRQVTAPKSSLWDKLRTLPILAEMSQWLPTISSSKGECQQVILQGDNVDLSLIPILKCWGYDGGRFVTLPMVNTIDPDTGQRNVGMYRMQVMDRNTTGMHWHIHKTGARHYDAYKRRGERMAVSVAIGGDPAYTYAATAPMPDNMDEYLLAGFLRRSKVKLVKSITNDIYVPADCDFVIEGYVDPTEEKVIEGPFGDHTGFYSLTDLYPRLHVTAITHRRNAIYPATIVGVPPQEDAYIAAATERIFISPIRFAMQPEVCDMTMPTAGTAHNIAIISMESRYPGQGRKLIQSMWGAGQMMFNKYLIVTSNTCDIRDNNDLAALMRGVDLSHAIVRAEGVMDVLDHATNSCGYGGKLALDLTMTTPAEECGESLEERWATQMIFADSDETIDHTQLIENRAAGVKFIVVLDCAAQGLTPYEMVWLAAANSDPRRDITIHNSANNQTVMVIDSRSKRPHRGDNPSRFPNVVTSLTPVIDLVDNRWSEYNIGELIESPSKRYRKLLLSESEQWI